MLCCLKLLLKTRALPSKAVISANGRWKLEVNADQPAVGLTTRICNSRNCFAVASDGAPIIEYFGALVHREQHHLAQVLLATQQHDNAVDAGRNAAVRRRAERQRACSMPPNLLCSTLSS